MGKNLKLLLSLVKKGANIDFESLFDELFKIIHQKELKILFDIAKEIMDQDPSKIQTFLFGKVKGLLD